ncbi:MAG: DUF4837 family protein [Bacteroidota bacterium]
MKSNILFLGFICSLLMLLTACEGDFRQPAKGDTREVWVVMDSTKWESATAEAIRNTIGGYIFTVPSLSGEANYDLIFTDIRSQGQLERLRSYKNVIFAAPIDEESNVGRQVRAFLDDTIENDVRSGSSFAFPVEDQWYRDQYVLILSSTSDSALADKITNTSEAILSNMLNKELKRWEYFVYEKKEQIQYSDSLWDDHGFKVRIQHDYIKTSDSTDFMAYSRILPDNERRMWVWWKDDVSDISFLDNEWINTTRDSLLQIYLRGSRDSTYVTTEYRRPVETTSFQKDRLLGYETLGTWRMEKAAMGGPFVNFTYYDPDSDRLFMVEYWQFAPAVQKKLRFIRQFRAMGRTFESDSSWTGARYSSL